MKEAILYDRLSGNKVRCNICQRRCEIPEGKRGYCWTRLNQKGELYSLAYGRVSFMSVAPIEKKPLYHFYPGSFAMSFGTLGCNFRCPGCQNWDIAHAKIDLDGGQTEYVSPEDSIKLAKRHGCEGMSWTYNEPSIWFEYTLDGARLSKKANLYTTYVTNGYITCEALDMIGPYLDAFRVDLKGFSKDLYKKIANLSDFRGILDVTKRAKDKWRMWVEIVTNIIPGYSDDETHLRKIASWIVKDLGEDTPWHVTQFIPHLKLKNLSPTPVATLERARGIGQDVGLRWVYIGNIPGHPGQNTYCPECNELLIERYDFGPVQNMLAPGGKCQNCGVEIPGRFH
ncbi:MAG: AmmeMemoRadiSam system radical SAM enzyme [bacterium]|nr:AmmeMemoRadiSam system radical SAM enzyme [bacterium]